MPQSSSSTPSSSSATMPKIKKRSSRYSIQELKERLQIIPALSAPLPPDLPPSPPASRAGSPAPSNKRKAEPSPDFDSAKRARTTNDRPSHNRNQPQATSQQSRLATANTAFNVKSEPSEDGEVKEETVVSSSSSIGGQPSSVVASFVPIRRPRRGRPSNVYFDDIHDRFHQYGRQLKYSGDARFWSTFPSSHKEYRPLPNPPPPNSPYHKYGGLIARLELIDALVCFAYSIWSKDYSRNACIKETWATIEPFVGWCKHKWQAEDTQGDREKAFIGLIWMVEAFIHGRKTAFPAKKGLDANMDKLVADYKKDIAMAIATAEQNPPAGSASGQAATGSHLTPPMLPSPASIAPANSANSTPTTRADSTPSTQSSNGSASATRPSVPMMLPPSLPLSMLPERAKGDPPLAPHVLAAAAAVTMPLGPAFIAAMKDQVGGVNSAAYCMDHSQKTLTLPIMAKHFPTTFARMVYSSLSPTEEYEPDIDDEEGELFWPGQLISGEGLGWVCLMGKAMIKEMGKEIGYMGLKGVVPKPLTGQPHTSQEKR